MKKIILMLSFGLLVAGTASAQENVKSDKKTRSEHRQDRHGARERKNPEAMATRHTEMLSKQLNLSKRQQRKVQEITLKRLQETEALRSRPGDAQGQDRGRRSTAHQEMKAINDRWEAELKDILSKKQYSQFEASRQEMKSRRLADRQERQHREGKRKEGKRHLKENRSRENG